MGVSIEGVGMTAKLAAAGRALESERTDRLFDDPLAAVLAGAEGVRWMQELRLPSTPVENPTIGPRTRYFDDLVVAATDAGIRQIVFVAAGMDTRAFRLPLPADAIVFEIDEDPVLAEKQQLLDRQGAEPVCRRVVVPADLAEATWPDLLVASGFDPSEPAVFVAEGLTYYLSEEENAALLDRLAGLAAPSSRLGLDMVNHDYLDNPAVAPYFELAAARGVHWRFGTNDPAGFLAAHGWQAKVSGFDDVGRRFGRWPPPGVPEEAAARAVKASRSFFISARRSS